MYKCSANDNIPNVYGRYAAGGGGGGGGGGGNSQWIGKSGGPIYYLSNVGIGTSNPLSTLDVNGNVYISERLQVDESFSVNTHSLNIVFNTLNIPYLNAMNVYTSNTLQVDDSFYVDSNSVNMVFNTLAIPYILSNVVTANIYIGDGGLLSNIHVSSFGNVNGGQSTNYTVSPNDYYIGCSSGITVFLPQGSTLSSGKTYVIKDEAGTASVNHITIQPYSGNLIDGQTSETLAVNYISITLLWTGTRWSII